MERSKGLGRVNGITAKKSCKLCTLGSIGRMKSMDLGSTDGETRRFSRGDGRMGR